MKGKVNEEYSAKIIDKEFEESNSLNFEYFNVDLTLFFSFERLGLKRV